ncbi:MAG: hypothetical protein NT084_11280 [Bacteroidetes bacterium]|nr:hypothetical protein [Bacteroidota bacterium]
MKNLKFIILAISCLVFVNEASSKLFERKDILEMKGIVKQTGSSDYSSEYVLDSALVTIYNETSITTTVLFSDDKGRCNLILPFDNKYTVSVSKNGFVTKIIYIDTRVSRKTKQHFVFPFDIDLFQKIEDVDISNLLKEPIAFVNFNIIKKDFAYNYNYTDRINAQIRKLYTEYYLSYSPINYLKSDSTTAITDQIPPEIISDQTVIGTIDANVIYKIQVIAVMSGPLPENHPVFSKCGVVEVYYNDGFFKYTTGEFGDFATAEKRLMELREIGFYDAFIVISKNEIQVPYEEINLSPAQ